MLIILTTNQWMFIHVIEETVVFISCTYLMTDVVSSVNVCNLFVVRSWLGPFLH